MRYKIIFHFVLLVIVALIMQRQYIHLDKITISDLVAVNYDTLVFTKNTILNYHQFPLWANHYMGGMPFFAHPQNYPLYFTTLLFVIIPYINVMLFLNILIIFTPVIAGLFMYILILKIRKNEDLALLGSVMFMCTGAMQGLYGTWLYRAYTVIWLPLIFLFLYKSFREDKFINNSLIIAVLLFFSFMSGGTDFFIFLSMLFAVFFLLFCMGKNPIKRMIKLSLIYIIIFIFFLGLISIKFLPLLEFGNYSSKSTNFNYEDFIGHHIDSLQSLIDYVLLGNPKIGIIVLLLASVSLINIRKRMNLFFVIMAILSLLIVSGIFIDYFLWRYIPGFAKMHHVDRALFLFSFSMVILAVDGASIIFSKIEKKNYNLLFILIIIMLIVELAVFGINNPYVPKNFEKQMNSNEVWNYISKDKELFRIQNFNTNTIGGRATQYALYFDQQILYGQSPIWIPEYFNVYLGIAHSSPAKFYGMLNTKYVYSENELNVSGLRFIEKFNKCETCDEDYPADKGISGPYLYLNEYYMPRAYLANYSILMIGDKDSVIQAMYWLMVNEHFSPANTVIIAKEGSIDQFDLETLKKYTAIFLTQGSVSQNSLYLLKSYVDNGGFLLPNIVNGSTNISAEEVEKLLDSFRGDYKNVNQVSYTYYSPNKQILNISGKKGFIVISEKYFMFEGWVAKIEGKLDYIWRADGINSAVYSDGNEDTLELYYHPKSFFMGLYITMATMFIIIIYFCYGFLNSMKEKNKSS